MTMSSRIGHNLGHLDIFERRRSHAKKSFEKLYGEIFRDQTKLDHCLKRLDCASKSYSNSILNCVPGLKIKNSPSLSFDVGFDCAAFRQPFSGQWGCGTTRPGLISL